MSIIIGIDLSAQREALSLLNAHTNAKHCRGEMRGLCLARKDKATSKINLIPIFTLRSCSCHRGLPGRRAVNHKVAVTVADSRRCPVCRVQWAHGDTGQVHRS
jgi:hypothetical protein